MDDIERELREKARRVRSHAGFFEWPVKETKELGVLRTLIEAAGQDELLTAIREVRPGFDPPDAVGTCEDGLLVDIEVTELVDQDVLENNVRVERDMAGQDWIERGRRRLMRVWDETGLVAAVDALLRKKDGGKPKGRPFARYAVVAHTNEDMLVYGEAERWLRDHSFGGLQQVTDAYLLFSYSPVIDGYPDIRLALTRASQ